MKKLITIAYLLLISLIIQGQTIEDIGKIIIGVDIPENSDIYSQENSIFLKNKILNILSANGYSSLGTTNFIIFPSITVDTKQIAEGNMRNIFVIDGTISLNLKDKSNGNIYFSDSYPYHGSGFSEKLAVKNGIQKVRYTDINEKLDFAKEKICNYYLQNQNKIFANADMLVSAHKYDAAIAVLMTIPEELTDLYTKAYGKAIEIYKIREQKEKEKIKQIIREKNNKVLVRAKGLNAAGYYIEALQTLWDYEIADTEQDALFHKELNLAGSKISAAQRAELEKEERAYRDAKEKERLNREDKLRAYEDAKEKERIDREDRLMVYHDEVHDRRQVQQQKFELQKDLNSSIKEIALEYLKNK